MPSLRCQRLVLAAFAFLASSVYAQTVTSALYATQTTTPSPSSTPNVQYRNVTYPNTSPSVFFGSGDVCNSGGCMANTWNPWVSTSYLDSRTGAPVTCQLITQAAARQSQGVPYVNFQFTGAAIYIWTVTNPASVGAFNVTVDGGTTWVTVRPNVTTPSYTANQLAWYKGGLDPARTSRLIIRFWADANGPSLDGADNNGSQLNLQAFVVAQPVPVVSTTSSTSSTTSTTSVLPVSVTGTATGNGLGATPRPASSPSRTGLIVGLAVGIPLFLILLVLLALLLLCLRRRRHNSNDSTASYRSPSPAIRTRTHKSSLIPSRPVDMMTVLDMGRDDAQPAPRRSRVTSQPLRFPQSAVGDAESSGETHLADTPADLSEEQIAVGLAGARRARRRAEQAAAATTSNDGHNKAPTPSSGRGGSSGEQGGSSGDGDSLYRHSNDIEQNGGSKPAAGTSPDAVSSLRLSALGSAASDHRFSGFEINIVNSDSDLGAQARTFPLRISSEPPSAGHQLGQVTSPMSVRSAPGGKSKEMHGSSRNRSPRVGADSSPPPTANDGDTTFRSLILGVTPDMNGHSPIASTPEPMPSAWEQSPHTPPKVLTRTPWGLPMISSKFGVGLGLASPASTVDPTFGVGRQNGVLPADAYGNPKSAFPTDSSEEDVPPRRLDTWSGQRRSRTRTTSSQAKEAHKSKFYPDTVAQRPAAPVSSN